MKKRLSWMLSSFALATLSFATVTTVVSCSNDKLKRLEPYLQKIDQMMKKPEELAEIKINSRYVDSKDPQKLLLSINEMLSGNINDIFKIQVKEKFINWNNEIKENQNLIKDEKEILTLDIPKLNNILYPSLSLDDQVNGQFKIDTLMINVNMSYPNPKNKKYFVKFEVDLKKYTFEQKDDSLKLEITNDSLINNIWKQAIKEHIKEQEISQEKAKNDRTLLNFQLEEKDFFDESIKNFYQKNMYVFLPNPVNSNNIDLILYFADSKEDNDVKIEDLKKRHFWSEIKNVELYRTDTI